MEQTFQTSFIPKKPILSERTSSRPAGLLTIFSIFIFFSMVIATGALFLYKGVLAKNIEKMGNDLTLAKNRFEPSKIAQLQVLDRRLKVANEILANHIAISPIFKALQDITMKTVRYTQFEYTLGTRENPGVQVFLKGEAVGYRSVALQSDLFAKNKNFIDPIFSNLSLNEKGDVLFDLEFTVDPVFVDYQELLKTQTEAPPEVMPLAPPM